MIHIYNLFLNDREKKIIIYKVELKMLILHE